MKKKGICILLVLIMSVMLFTGDGVNNTAKEDADTITVYLWTTAVKAF